MLRAISLFLALLAMLHGPVLEGAALDVATAERLAKLALDCVSREYPNKLSHVLNSDEDAKPPRHLTPAFYGCYDWHSAVHGHWLLARLARLFPEARTTAASRAALARALTPMNIKGEVAYLNGKGRETFERPYGLAWLLQLALELREWNEPEPRAWAGNLRPLEEVSARRLGIWIPKLAYPIREGEHAQTAFAFGLALDWARGTGDAAMARLLEGRARDLYQPDRSCPLDYEPSGQDFLSPCLAEADLIRRVLEPVEFAAWLGAFLPGLPIEKAEAPANASSSKGEWLKVAIVTDPTDGKLAHLDGLNLSRAWMLEGIAQRLPAGDPRVGPLSATARRHKASGLAAVTGEHYEGGHWLGTFAVYLVTSRGLR